MATKEKKQAEVVVFDLSKKEGLSAYKEGKVEATSPDEYVKTGNTNTFFGKFPVFVGNGVYVIDNGKVHWLDTYGEVASRVNNEIAPDAVVVLDRTAALMKSQNQKQKVFFILNGDEENNAMVGEVNDCPVLSFECLRRFYDNKPNVRTNIQPTMNKVVSRLIDGTIKVVDFTNEERRPLTKKDKEAVKLWNKDRIKNQLPKPPSFGFTLVGSNEWHRSGTVLLYDTEKKVSIIVGQDEGTYFGCELADNPKTVSDAFLSLMPKSVRDVKGVERQGEWFALPVPESKVPKIEEAIFLVEDTIALPVDNAASNRHFVQTTDGRIDKNGVFYARDACVEHSEGQHADMRTYGWVTYVRNTARRSFSVAGVD
jgi:hypothetical protein